MVAVLLKSEVCCITEHVMDTPQPEGGEYIA